MTLPSSTLSLFCVLTLADSPWASRVCTALSFVFPVTSGTFTVSVP